MLYYNVIILRAHRPICGPSLIETSLRGAYLYFCCDILGVYLRVEKPAYILTAGQTKKLLHYEVGTVLTLRLPD